MPEDKGTPTTPTQKKEPDKRAQGWERFWARTGFGDKTLWDLLQLLIVPLVLVGIGLLFEMHQQIENQRAEAERELAEQRAQDEVMQAYFDQMSSLLFEKDLRASEEDSEVRTLARARTLTMISRFDPRRKVDVMRFLEEASLIQGVEGRGPIISLTGADLRDVDLHFADLSGATLSGANLDNADLSDAELSGADLNGAYLSNTDLSRANLDDANLRWATLSNANLSNATLHDADLYFADLSGADLNLAYLSDATLFSAILTSADLYFADLSDATLSNAYVTDAQLTVAGALEGATMPNGQKYEDWLKSKRRGEGEVGGPQ